MVIERFAPSPTGFLHLGHAYSAWCGWTAAQETDGTFLLRMEDLDAGRDAIDEDTRAIFCESIANPGGYVTDIRALADIADAAGIPLIVAITHWLMGVRKTAHGDLDAMGHRV